MAPNKLIAAAVAIASFGLGLRFAEADTFEMFKKKVADAIKCTDDKKCTELEEHEMIANAGIARLKELMDVTVVGLAELNGQEPAALVTVGSINELTYMFVDPLTLEPTTGPAISSVFYEYSPTPDVPGSFTPLGTSTDAATDFALPYLALPTEEAIVAEPLFDGNPVFIQGVDPSDNAAVGLVTALLVPEPSTWAMMALGFACLGYAGYRRSRTPRAA
jgi:hypothetical protein